MTSFAVDLSVNGQIVLGLLLFMFSIFGGVLASGDEPEAMNARTIILHGAMLVLPASSAVCAAIIYYGFHLGFGSPSLYWLNIVPLALASLYLLYLVKVKK